MATPLSCAASTPSRPSIGLSARRARRVVLVKRQFSLRYGGGERYSVNLARALAESGYDVTVVGTLIDDELKSEVKFIPVRCQRHGVRARVMSFAKNAAAAVREIKADAVIGLCLTPEADVLRVTSRIHPHWMRIRYSSQWRYALENFNPRHRALLDLERAALVESRRVQAYVVQSQLDRKLLSAYYMTPPDRIHVVRNGVDSETFHPRLRKEGRLRKELLGSVRGPLVVFAANRDFRGKGLATLLEGFAASESSNAQLAVLGGDCSHRYRRMARRLGLEDRVHF
ncbi:MAG: glycosyltransferase family 4 protein, partial [Planctomycetales bacterium]|nr:glycosyltransferase family 4 protein [Planctomycetales bacterium]